MFPKGLSNLQLRHALLTNDITKDKFNYIISADLLKYVEECPSMIIVNTDCHTGQGQHWILMYFPDTTTVMIWNNFQGTKFLYYPNTITTFKVHRISSQNCST